MASDRILQISNSERQDASNPQQNSQWEMPFGWMGRTTRLGLVRRTFPLGQQISQATDTVPQPTAVTPIQPLTGHNPDNYIVTLQISEEQKATAMKGWHQLHVKEHNQRARAEAQRKASEDYALALAMLLVWLSHSP